MIESSVTCVVGIDVDQRAHVVCALEAPSGTVRQRPKPITATAEGYAQLRDWLGQWGAPGSVLIGVEATGSLWEPLREALTQAGYRVVVLNPRQTASWATSLG